VVALPIADGLQHPHQGIHEVLQVLPPLKSCSKSDFRGKFVNTYFLGLTFLHLFTKYNKNLFCGLGVKAFFKHFFTQKLSSVNLFCEKPCQIKSFSLITIKIH
jgi:hypothetical protein